MKKTFVYSIEKIALILMFLGYGKKLSDLENPVLIIMGGSIFLLLRIAEFRLVGMRSRGCKITVSAETPRCKRYTENMLIVSQVILPLTLLAQQIIKIQGEDKVSDMMDKILAPCFVVFLATKSYADLSNEIRRRRKCDREDIVELIIEPGETFIQAALLGVGIVTDLPDIMSLINAGIATQQLVMLVIPISILYCMKRMQRYWHPENSSEIKSPLVSENDSSTHFARPEVPAIPYWSDSRIPSTPRDSSYRSLVDPTSEEEAASRDEKQQEGQGKLVLANNGYNQLRFRLTSPPKDKNLRRESNSAISHDSLP